MPKNRGKKSFLVIGLGVFGKSVALTLARMGCNVVGIDKDPKVVDEVRDELTHVMEMDATDEDALKEVGVKDFDVCIVGRGSDLGDSILIVDNLKRLGAKHVVAKALNDRQADLLKNVGANEVIIPERETGKRLAHTLASFKLRVKEYMELGDDIGLEEIEAPEEFEGKTLAELDLRKRHGVTVLAIKRGKEMIPNPGGDSKVEKGDILVLMGKTEALERLGSG